MTFPPVGAHSPTGPGSMDQVLRSLLNHATQGFNLPDYWEAKGMGYDAWLEWQLDYEAIDDSAVDSALAYYPTLTMNNPTLYTTYVNDAATVVYELQDANLRRSIYSRKQLYERMVEFWTDHFSISQLDDYCLWFKTRDEARVIRKHALGSFPEMLRNSPKSAAMLWYLDNWNNQAGAVQENYARELLELHTLGVDGPYTQQDVVEVARCFTGWTFTGLYDSQPIGLFSFKGNYHDYGQKTVLGNVINGSGVSEGEQVIDILATHPKTAEFISTKMARWLLGYEPPQDLIDRLVQIYLSTQGSIKPMVREILSMEVLGKVKPEVRTKFKRPYHVVTSIMRAARVSSSNLLALTSELQRLGHVPYWYATPDGYPDTVEKWGRSLLPRWQFLSRLFGGYAGGGIIGNTVDTIGLGDLMDTAPPGSNYAQQIDWVLTGGDSDPAHVAEVQAYKDAHPNKPNAVLRESFVLLASSPSYQLYS